MPRTSASNKQLVAKYLREFPAELFRSDGDILYCTACDKRVSCSQRSQVTQHIATRSHIENKNRNKERTSYQAFLTSPSSSKSTLSTDLCRALVRADISFHKLKNPHFKGFLETYIGKKMPDESTLRKNYLEYIYKDTLTKIREHIKDGPIWVSIDETSDVEDDVAKLAEKAIRVANLHSATLISPYNQIKPTTPEASPTLIRSARVELDRKSARVNSSVTIIGQMVGKATGYVHNGAVSVDDSRDDRSDASALKEKRVSVHNEVTHTRYYKRA
uniref:Uncharacterized protein n=1 Tax=Rhodnius prolixus TaxID=13249 RepID=T1HE70_RHOPR